MPNMYEANISLCDPLNEGFGYSVRITFRGETIFFGSKNPVDGKDLLSFDDALEVTSYYGEAKWKRHAPRRPIDPNKFKWAGRGWGLCPRCSAQSDEPCTVLRGKNKGNPLNWVHIERHFQDVDRHPEAK